MSEVLQSPADATYWLLSGRILFSIISLLGVACFTYIVVKRLAPLRRGQRDFRFDRPWNRLGRLLQFWLGQWRHPRYRTAGIIHILLFAGFIILVARAFSLLILGISGGFVMPGFTGRAGHVYHFITNYATTVVFLAVVIAALRRLLFKPARYAVPARYGKAHAADAIFLLALIAILMAADSLFACLGPARPPHSHSRINRPSPWPRCRCPGCCRRRSPRLPLRSSRIYIWAPFWRMN
jgi:hypothetical protein